jgi:glycerol-3-phosphate acyltransferase PlsX
MKEVRIALDAMGGDFLAVPNLQGATKAVERAQAEGRKLKVFLCGPQDRLLSSVQAAAQDPGASLAYRLNEKLFRSFLNDGFLEIVDCPTLVDMSDSPAAAIRTKKDSSLAKTFYLVKENRADAALSAGNSGAVMAFGVALLGRLPDVKRPAILCQFPAAHGITVLMDAGANVDCSPEILYQFAIMGLAYYQSAYQKPEARVCLMNIGEEDSKGNELVKATHIILKERLGTSYHGFVEGRDLMNGKADVIICDGFVGNIILKTTEGVASTIKNILRDEIQKSWVSKLGAVLAGGAFHALRSKMDYREYGAAPLIGLNGLGLVAHGSSDGKAICNAILIAEKYVRQDVTEKVRNAFVNYQPSTVANEA